MRLNKLAPSKRKVQPRREGEVEISLMTHERNHELGLSFRLNIWVAGEKLVDPTASDGLLVMSCDEDMLRESYDLATARSSACGFLMENPVNKEALLL